MRVVTGKVVQGKVVIEELTVEEGSAVTVLARDAAVPGQYSQYAGDRALPPE